MENEMSNHDWNDASVTPCPTGVPVQITYLHPYLSGYHTAEGEVLAAGRCILTPDRNTVALASIVSWRHRPEPEIPTMVPSKAFPGRWWWDGTLNLPTGFAMCYSGRDGTHCYSARNYRTPDAVCRTGYPTVAEAMQAAEQYILDTVGELT
jgi:hypothetical protein